MEFAYVRVSTTTQITDSQIVEILKSYHSIEIFTDVCSGTIPAYDRPELKVLLEKTLREGDVLVVW